MTQEKVFNDLKVNQGFPAGYTYKDLKVGRWVKTRWSDQPDDEWGFIVEADGRPHNYKGDRSLKVFTFDKNGRPLGLAHPVHTQIVQYGPMMDHDKPLPLQATALDSFSGAAQPTWLIRHGYRQTKAGTLPSGYELLVIHEGEVIKVANLSQSKAQELATKLELSVGD